MAVGQAGCEAIWLRKILHGLFDLELGPTVIHCDNQSCMKLMENPVFHERTKHISIKYHFIRDNVQDGKVKIKYINTAGNLADLFTKLVGKTTLQRTRQGLGLKTQHDAVAWQSPALPLREAVEGNETKQGSRPG